MDLDLKLTLQSILRLRLEIASLAVRVQDSGIVPQDNTGKKNNDCLAILS